MGRRLRDHMPGMPFHLTARVQARAPLFVGLEAAAVRAVLEATLRSDARLLAWAIMPNHIHAVVIQGWQPLSTFMQPLMRRLAGMLKRAHGLEGHVFERRYHSRPCEDAEHLRNAIAYTHLNPVRASLCKLHAAHLTTSHGWYAAPGVAAAELPSQLHLAAGMRLFADDTIASPEQRARAYMDFIRWRIMADAADEAGQPCPAQPEAATSCGYWATELRSQLERGAPMGRVDLRDLALIVIAEHEPGMPLELLRSGARLPSVVSMRRLFIARARTAGHAGVRIASFLRVAESTVSAAWKAAGNSAA